MVELKKNKLLVIGGTGFIGTVLLEEANKLGFKTTSLSLNQPSYKNFQKQTRYLCLDTSNRILLEKALDQNFNYVVNLGSYINHNSIKDDGFCIISEQLNLLNNLTSLLNTSNLIRFVQVGSSDEYGLTNSPQKEDFREMSFSPYSFSKVMNTHYLQMLNLSENFPSVILRLFLVYGPHQKFDRLVPYVIKSCLLNENFNLSAGDQIKNFCYVKDVAKAITQSLKSPNIEGQIINIGSSKIISIREIVEKIRSSIKMGKPNFKKINIRNIENKNLYPDISKAKKLLNWAPETSLETGLKETILWYKSNLSKKND